MRDNSKGPHGMYYTPRVFVGPHPGELEFLGGKHNRLRTEPRESQITGARATHVIMDEWSDFDYTGIEARVLAHYAKTHPPIPVTFAEMYGAGGDGVAAYVYGRAQAADAPAPLRDWFWEAVRRGCTDPDLS